VWALIAGMPALFVSLVMRLGETKKVKFGRSLRDECKGKKRKEEDRCLFCWFSEV
jgi:hypothetical protein